MIFHMNLQGCDDTGKCIEVDELSGVALVKMADDGDDCCVDGRWYRSAKIRCFFGSDDPHLVKPQRDGLFH